MAIKETNNKLHHNFQVGSKARPLGYKGINLGISIAA